jgi:hypothetical protein
MEITDKPLVPASTIVTAYREESTETTPGEPAVLSAVSRSIFIETPRDFFSGIGNFFKRYYIHYKSVFTFLNRPALHNFRQGKGDFRESAQLSFEISLLLVAALLFMIKQNMIPVDKSLQEMYGNDIMQMFMEFAIFIMLGVAFFGQLLLSVLLGRVQRLFFSVPVSRKESDTLYCLLNNSFFSISAFLAFFLRLGAQFEQLEAANSTSGIYVLCFFLSFFGVGWWSFRFAKLHKLRTVKKAGFHLFSLLFLTILYGTGMSAICAFVLGT